MQAEELKELVVQALEDLKAIDVRVLDVRDKTSITDLMVIASGTSDRHVRALANSIIETAKEHGVRPLGTEGEQMGEWILVDLVDVVVHVMLPQIRDFYNLEKLWAFEDTPSASANRSS
jgi:ribosome-associated protein